MIVQPVSELPGIDCKLKIQLRKQLMPVEPSQSEDLAMLRSDVTLDIYAQAFRPAVSLLLLLAIEVAEE